MSSTNPSTHILQAQWLTTGVIVEFSDGIFSYFPAEFLVQHRDEFLLPDEPAIEKSH